MPRVGHRAVEVRVARLKATVPIDDVPCRREHHQTHPLYQLTAHGNGSAARCARGACAHGRPPLQRSWGIRGFEAQRHAHASFATGVEGDRVQPKPCGCGQGERQRLGEGGAQQGGRVGGGGLEAQGRRQQHVQLRRGVSVEGGRGQRHRHGAPRR